MIGDCRCRSKLVRQKEGCFRFMERTLIFELRFELKILFLEHLEQSVDLVLVVLVVVTP